MSFGADLVSFKLILLHGFKIANDTSQPNSQIQTRRNQTEKKNSPP
jgi:hypothetical protein